MNATAAAARAVAVAPGKAHSPEGATKRRAAMRAETISRCVNSAMMSRDAAFNVFALVFGAALPIALVIAVLFYVAE